MLHRVILASALFLSTVHSVASSLPPSDGGSDKATVRIECTRASALVNISILHERRIGKVRITISDDKGKLYYIEEGKALRNELVRRIDKQGFAKGELILSVEARDFNITQRFRVD